MARARPSRLPRALLVAAALALPAAPAAAGILKAIGDAIRATQPRAEAVDPQAYAKLTHLIVIAGQSRYKPVQEIMLKNVEQRLREAGCWHVMDHGEAREKLAAASVGAPSPRTWKDDGEVAAKILARLPKRDERLGVLVFWVRDWRGDVYSRATVNEVVDRWLTKRVNPPGSMPARGEYERDAVAELFDSESGAPIWRGHMLYASGTPLDQNGRLPYADQDVRDAQVKKEYDDFVDFFAKSLTQPPNMQNGCRERPELFAAARLGASAAAVSAAGAAGDIPPPPEFAQLKSKDGAARIAAIKKLARPDYEDAVPPLVAVLSDPDLKVRANALEALGVIGSPKAVEPVAAKLTDQEALLRALAARALGRIGSERAKPALEKLLVVEKQALVRQEAEAALKRIDDPMSMKMDVDLDSLGR